MKRFILMLQFLTRIPINMNLDVNEDDFFEGVIYFPLVGLIIGMFVVAFYYIGTILSDKLLGAVFAVIIEVFITGGLHLDGLADTFDGVYSNRQKDRILEIMKDSRLGTNGALALFVLLILKIVLINSLKVPDVYAVLLLMPIFAKLNVVLASRIASPARKQGMGNLFIGKVSTGQFLIAFIIAIIPSLIFLKIVPVIGLMLIFSILYVRHISNRIDGMTGDTLGSLSELSEVAFLLFIVILFR
ncbi:adenosylcobinamide-GDP ribazoletransferase [Maledivibacter halophilus]|uniref:Adenosylcobinamide-GDP ribazoletransferase n=1 Tax=Maledivibacter halophilus TaxID=36842 RepID=A0A1T5LIE8_9FIRM|nr:adenosylcobinamide-GDP ribazoletransferase [Maledivibacter halophilus]SKC75772.1 cobalamin-5'-phosphate synthase [Maledivibacter halophilus]